MLKKINKKNIFLSCVIFSVIAVVIYFNHNFSLKNININNPTSLEVSNTSKDVLDLGDGYSLGIDIVDTTKQNIDKVNGVISIDSPKDNLEISFSNNTNHEQFICKVFYDYKEVEFQVSGENVFDTSYTFDLEPTKTMKIPIQLDKEILKDNKSHKLTVGIYKVSENVNIEDRVTNFYGMTIDYEVFYTERGEIILNEQYSEVEKTIDNINFSGLMINTELNPPDSSDSIPYPPKLIRVKKGEKIELSYFVNLTNYIPEDLENYLILSMLDWKQIKMNDKPYLLLEKNSLVTDHGKFYITAPNKEGLYNFTAFIVPNADKNKNEDNYFPIETTYQFIIEVID